MEAGRRARIGRTAAALLVLAAWQGAGAGGDATLAQPLDGGDPLNLSRGPEADRSMADDPCWRRERGGWHSSIGHCEEMLPAQPLAGVLVIGFEEMSFFPGTTAIPDPDDPRRYRFSLEADFLRVRALAGSMPDHPPYQAYRIAFTGRRTRYPVYIDCEAGRGYVFIVDRLDEAQYLGPMPDTVFDLSRPLRAFARSGQGGKMKELEDRALANCFGG